MLTLRGPLIYFPAGQIWKSKGKFASFPIPGTEEMLNECLWENRASTAQAMGMLLVGTKAPERSAHHLPKVHRLDGWTLHESLECLWILYYQSYKINLLSTPHENPQIPPYFLKQDFSTLTLWFWGSEDINILFWGIPSIRCLSASLTAPHYMPAALFPVVMIKKSIQTLPSAQQVRMGLLINSDWRDQSRQDSGVVGRAGLQPQTHLCPLAAITWPSSVANLSGHWCQGGEKQEWFPTGASNKIDALQAGHGGLCL